MENKYVGKCLFLWILILSEVFMLLVCMFQIIIGVDKGNRDTVFFYCFDYVREDFIQEYGNFEITMCSGEISYIKGLDDNNVKSAGYKIEINYLVDNIWNKSSYHIDIWWKERNFLDRRTDLLREKQIIDYKIVSLQ